MIGEDRTKEINEKLSDHIDAVKNWTKSNKYMLACVLTSYHYEVSVKNKCDIAAIEELCMRLIRLTLEDKVARQLIADGIILVNVPFIKIGTEKMPVVLDFFQKKNPDIKGAEAIKKFINALLISIAKGMDDDDSYEMGTILAELAETSKISRI